MTPRISAMPKPSWCSSATVTSCPSSFFSCVWNHCVRVWVGVMRVVGVLFPCAVDNCARRHVPFSGQANHGSSSTARRPSSTLFARLWSRCRCQCGTNSARAARKRSVLLRGKAPGPLLSHPVSLYASWTIPQSHLEVWNGAFRIPTHYVNPNVLSHPGIGIFLGKSTKCPEWFDRLQLDSKYVLIWNFGKEPVLIIFFVFRVMTVVVFYSEYVYFCHFVDLI